MESSKLSDLIFTSWNVRGLNKLTKLKQVMNRLKNLHSKIIFLQEIHMTATEIKKVQHRWPGQVIHATYNNYARGVLILIHKTVPFQLTNIIQDPQGRFVIAQGGILSLTLNLVSIYGPNEDNPKFFEDFFLTLSSLYGLNIIGGDLNCTLNPLVDRSTKSDPHKKQSRKIILQYITDLNLSEIWRKLNPNKLEYSCYSGIHKSRSRIDYFLVSQELVSKIKNCWYDCIVISDHSPISMSVQIEKLQQSPPNWRLQVKWLKNPEFVKYLEDKIDTYFQINTNQTNACIRWEAFKAYIRGQIISFTSTKNREQKAEINELERQIKSLEIDINNKDDPEKQKRLLILRTEYNKLTSDRAAKSLLWLNQAFYDQGEKAGKLLAWRIKKMQSERAINAITTKSGEISNDPQDINNTFKEFYQSLYRSECSPMPACRDTFLNHLQFKSLTDDVKEDLDKDISMEELLQAIKSINSGKAPGPDGLPIEFYKTFQKQLLTPLLDMFNESFNNEILPPTLRLATIILILKPGKIATDCSSYRPISLMGVDTKILCKVLAKRLDPHIPFLVHSDQNGFVQTRQGFHNIRRVLNIIHSKNNARDTALLSLDARQAFDRIEWHYLFNLLPRYGLGGKFLKWIELLYTNPTARVMTNNNLSSPLTLERSTRQGCPLSPLLFILAIEPLAMSIRNDANLSGIAIGDYEHRISLYADDVILFLSNLSNSVQTVLHLINRFGQFSGYSINNAKSSILFLNKDERINPVITTPFFNAREGFTYLGIKITPQINTVVHANYDPLMREVQESLEKWTTMPISMIGRINIIKMTILPKFLYLFQSLPMPLPKSFFKEINRAFCRFIWNNRKPRLRLRLLYLPYDRGGLQMPSLQWYYWSAQLRSAMFYFVTHSPPAWVHIEQASISKLPLSLYLYSADFKLLKKKTTNPFLKNSIDVWYKAHGHIGDTPLISQFSPVWGNEQFTPGRADGGFRAWADNGVQKIGDLYAQGTLLTFNDLCAKYRIPKKHFFKYLQLKHFISSKSHQNAREPPLSCLEDIVLKHMNGKRQISILYAVFVSHDEESSHDRRRAWSLDIKEDIEEAEWATACRKAQTQTINTRMKLLQHKWLMRTYITPEKLNKWSPGIPDTCVKCLTEKGTLIHCVWECPKLITFWKMVVDTLSRIVGTRIPCVAKLCILGIFPDCFSANSKTKTLVNFGLLQARRMVALSWKETEVSSMRSWMEEMAMHVALERLTYVVKGGAHKFEEVWTPLVDFLRRQ